MKWRDWLKAVGAAVVAIAGLCLAWIFRRHKVEEAGEEVGRLKADKERVKEAEAAGDDDAVLREFRRQAKL